MLVSGRMIRLITCHLLWSHSRNLSFSCVPWSSLLLDFSTGTASLLLHLLSHNHSSVLKNRSPTGEEGYRHHHKLCQILLVDLPSLPPSHYFHTRSCVINCDHWFVASRPSQKCQSSSLGGIATVSHRFWHRKLHDVQVFPALVWHKIILSILKK